VQLTISVVPFKNSDTTPVNKYIEILGTGWGPIIAKYQLSPTCTLLASAGEFKGHFMQTTVINGDRAESLNVLTLTASSIYHFLFKSVLLVNLN
jgi:hypothetical protein